MADKKRPARKAAAADGTSNQRLALLVGVAAVVAAVLGLSKRAGPSEPIRATLILKMGRQIRDPAAALAFYASHVNKTDCKSSSSQILCMSQTALLLDEVGDLHAGMHNFKAAAKAHLKSLKMKRQSPIESNVGGLILTAASLATDYKMTFRYGKALKVLAEAQRVPHLPTNVEAILFRQESNILDCKGDTVSALHRFEHAQQMQDRSDHSSAEDFFETVQTHIDLLQRTRNSVPPPPPEVGMAMAKRAAKLISVLLDSGPWTSAWQLPRTFLPGLASAPFLDMAAYPALQPLAKLLEAKQQELQDEFLQLEQKKAMAREQECIHDAALGHWTRYEITWTWLELDSNNCSIHTPVACQVFKEMNDLDIVPVMRAGFSVVDANTWIKPHYGQWTLMPFSRHSHAILMPYSCGCYSAGMTNAQLKFHLGLIVPSEYSTGTAAGSTGPCAKMRVGNSTRGWEEGKVQRI
jgi:hypothetical protein